MENYEKSFLLNLAKESIALKFQGKDFKYDETKIPNPLKKKRGTFVTLKINKQLKGCIGHIIPIQEIYKDVIENARAAAFEDPRFLPLTKNEFKKISIEISILSESKKLEFKSLKELIEILEKTKPGVILRKGRYVATFLPQVWEELENAEEFLTHLCLKAGLNPKEWEKNEIEIETYSVEKIS